MRRTNRFSLIALAILTFSGPKAVAAEPPQRIILPPPEYFGIELPDDDIAENDTPGLSEPIFIGESGSTSEEGPGFGIPSYIPDDDTMIDLPPGLMIDPDKFPLIYDPLGLQFPEPPLTIIEARRE